MPKMDAARVEAIITVEVLDRLHYLMAGNLPPSDPEERENSDLGFLCGPFLRHTDQDRSPKAEASVGFPKKFLEGLITRPESPSCKILREFLDRICADPVGGQLPYHEFRKKITPELAWSLLRFEAARRVIYPARMPPHPLAKRLMKVISPLLGRSAYEILERLENPMFQWLLGPDKSIFHRALLESPELKPAAEILWSFLDLDRNKDPGPNVGSPVRIGLVDFDLNPDQNDHDHVVKFTTEDPTSTHDFLCRFTGEDNAFRFFCLHRPEKPPDYLNRPRRPLSHKGGFLRRVAITAIQRSRSTKRLIEILNELGSGIEVSVGSRDKNLYRLLQTTVPNERIVGDLALIQSKWKCEVNKLGLSIADGAAPMLGQPNPIVADIIRYTGGHNAINLRSPRRWRAVLLTPTKAKDRP